MNIETKSNPKLVLVWNPAFGRGWTDEREVLDTGRMLHMDVDGYAHIESDTDGDTLIIPMDYVEYVVDMDAETFEMYTKEKAFSDIVRESNANFEADEREAA